MVKIMEKYLMGNFGSILEIHNNDYYILNDDESAMQKVDLKKFKEEVKKFKHLADTTWNKEFKNDYYDIVSYLETIKEK